MSEKLDFSLPEKKGGGSFGRVLTVLLLLLLVALAAANLFVAFSGRDGRPAQVTGNLTAAQAKQLATRLDQRNLHDQAAALWQDYLAADGLTADERARALYHIGTSLKKAGRYGEAIEHFYRSELAAPLDDLGPQINAHVKECFEKLGKFSALRYELMDRTSLKPSEPAGGKVVAEIGAEKITEAELDAQIERAVENQLAPMEAYLPPDQLGEQKKRLLGQYRDPKTKQEFLRTWLAQEILYRQALDDGLGDKPETKQVLEDLTRGVLSQQLMNEKLASRINITETDVQTFYQANKDKYVQPARARIAHIRVAEEDKTADLLTRLTDGEDFAALAREFSEDEATKAGGGAVEQDIVKGTYVAGIGDANDINAAIFAAEAPAVLKQAFQTENGWEIVKVNEKHPERQMGFEEVQQQVMQELLGRKRQEVQSDYIKEMMNRHNVIIHASALAPAQPNASEAPSPQP